MNNSFYLKKLSSLEFGETRAHKRASECMKGFAQMSKFSALSLFGASPFRPAVCLTAALALASSTMLAQEPQPPLPPAEPQQVEPAPVPEQQPAPSEVPPQGPTTNGWPRVGDPANQGPAAGAPNGAYPPYGQYGPPPPNGYGYPQGPGPQQGPPQGMMTQQGPMPPYQQPPIPAQLTIKPGTYITARVNQFLSSDKNQAGDFFSATLVRPIVVDGVVVATPGQTIGGRVAEAVKAGRVKGVSRLGLELTDLTLVDGQQFPIKTQFVSRYGPTSVGRDAGAIAGTTALGAAAGAAADWGRGAAIGAGAGAFVGIVGVLVTRGEPTIVRPEQMLTFRVETPVTFSTERSQAAFHYIEPGEYGTGAPPASRPGYGYPGYPGYPSYSGYSAYGGYPYYYPYYGGYYWPGYYPYAGLGFGFYYGPGFYGRGYFGGFHRR
jgi:hypothetical protein